MQLQRHHSTQTGAFASLQTASKF